MAIMICISTLGHFVKPGFAYHKSGRSNVLRLWRLQVTWEHRP